MPTMPKKQAVPAFLAKLGVKESEWQYALKSGFRVLMRPGWDLRVRTYAALTRQSLGFKRDLAVMQVRTTVKGDPPKQIPLYPGGLVSILQSAAIEAYRESGIEADEEQRKKLLIDRSNMRRMLRSMEEDDGAILCVRANCNPQKLIDESIPLEVALAKGLVVPLSSLTSAERQNCSNRSLLYIRAQPKAATANALNRHVDLALEVVNNDNLGAPNLPPSVQLIFDFMRRQGNADPALAAKLANTEEGRAVVQQFVEAEQLFKLAKEGVKDFVLRKSIRETNHAPAPAVEQAPLFEAPSSVRVSEEAPPLDQPSEDRAVEETTPELVSRPRKQAEDWNPIHAALDGVAYDESGVIRLVKRCREIRPDATPSDIAWAIGIKRGLGNRKSMMGRLIQFTYQCFEGEGLDRHHRELEEEQTRVRANEERSARAALEMEQEFKAADRRRDHLRQHPEECPDCHGTGRMKHHSSRNPVQCPCPAGDANPFTKRQSA